MIPASKLSVYLVLTFFICIIYVSNSGANDNLVPATFTKYWKNTSVKLKKKQYDVFLVDSLWPQLAGYSTNYKTKKAFISDCNKYWSKYTWKSPKIYKDKDKFADTSEVDVIRVEYGKEDIMFEYVEQEGGYKLVAIFTNLSGGD